MRRASASSARREVPASTATREARTARRCCAHPVAEHSELAEHGAGTDLGDRLAVDLDLQHAVEEHEHVGAGLALFDHALARNQAAPFELRAAASQHDLVELVLELAAGPRGLLERLVVPAVVVGESVLRDKTAVGAVDRVARERARRDEPALRRAVGADHHLQRGPGGRGADVQIRLAAKRARRGQADPTADGLLESHEGVTDLCLRPEDRKLDRRKRDLIVGPVDPRARDERTAATAVVDDQPVLDADPRPKLVRLAKGVGGTQAIDVAERLGRRLVEVRHRDPEGKARHRVEHAEREPGDRRDRRLDTHHAVAASVRGAAESSSASPETTS